MFGARGIAIQFQIFNGQRKSSYENEHNFYTVHLNERDANVRVLAPLLRTVLDEHATEQAEDGHEPASRIIINLPVLCDPSVDPPRYMKMAHAIAHAVDQTRGDIPFEYMSLLFEDVGIEDLWAWMLTLPASIEVLEVGMCAPAKWVVPSAVWEHLPRLKTIAVLTSRTNDGAIGPAVEITRPLG